MTLEAFMRPPTRAQWRWALASGWPGPDGSSMSTDAICGVEIGVTSRDWKQVALPANAHDWRYFLGRLCGLPEEYRAEADRAYRDGCLERVRADLTGWKRTAGLLALAVSRCHARYAGLRIGARFAWTQAQRLRNLAWAPAFPGAGGET